MYILTGNDVYVYIEGCEPWMSTPLVQSSPPRPVRVPAPTPASGAMLIGAPASARSSRSICPSRCRSCHRCSLAVSWVGKPKIRGRYRSTFAAAVAVDPPGAAAGPLPAPPPTAAPPIAGDIADKGESPSSPSSAPPSDTPPGCTVSWARAADVRRKGDCDVGDFDGSIWGYTINCIQENDSHVSAGQR